MCKSGIFDGFIRSLLGDEIRYPVSSRPAAAKSEHSVVLACEHESEALLQAVIRLRCKFPSKLVGSRYQEQAVLIDELHISLSANRS
ncbi:hypothetical protein D3C78_1142580 [compost metagenome]